MQKRFGGRGVGISWPSPHPVLPAGREDRTTPDDGVAPGGGCRAEQPVLLRSASGADGLEGQVGCGSSVAGADGRFSNGRVFGNRRANGPVPYTNDGSGFPDTSNERFRCLRFVPASLLEADSDSEGRSISSAAPRFEPGAFRALRNSLQPDPASTWRGNCFYRTGILARTGLALFPQNEPPRPGTGRAARLPVVRA